VVTLLLSTPCEHGSMKPHQYSGEVNGYGNQPVTSTNWVDCPGGSLTPLEPDIEAAARRALFALDESSEMAHDKRVRYPATAIIAAALPHTD
jgi:hypothetical protein